MKRGYERDKHTHKRRRVWKLFCIIKMRDLDIVPSVGWAFDLQLEENCYPAFVTQIFMTRYNTYEGIELFIERGNNFPWDWDRRTNNNTFRRIMRKYDNEQFENMRKAIARLDSLDHNIGNTIRGISQYVEPVIEENVNVEIEFIRPLPEYLKKILKKVIVQPFTVILVFSLIIMLISAMIIKHENVLLEHSHI